MSAAPNCRREGQRRLALARTGYGMVLLAAPRAVLGLVRVEPEDRAARRFVRLLGARHLAEGVALVLWPSARSRNSAAATDLAHAASVAILAWRLPAHRHSLAVNGVTALMFATLSLAPSNRAAMSHR